jgi:TolB-like protein/tetratricopeptide (TPR) repeat protein
LLGNALEFESRRSKLVFERLVDAFVDDYTKKKNTSGNSGWRSIPRLAKELNVSTSAMYGKHGGMSPEFGELLRKGLVETRVFKGEPGRGGEVTRVRIAFDSEPVREHIRATNRILAAALQAHQITLPTNRVAVLPFVNIGPDSSDEYLADGMTEELTGRLSQIRGLDVIARTSAVRFTRDAKRSAEYIGRELRAGTLIEGSIRRSKDRIRVSVQAIDANTSGHLWSSTYERSLHDIFGVQAEIAEQTARSLQVRILPGEKRMIRKEATGSSEAHALYLKGRKALLMSTESFLEESLSCFEGAIRMDPSYASAYAGLADCYSMLGDAGYIPQQEAMSRAESSATKALELDEGLAEAHTATAALYYHKYDWKGAEHALRRSLELEPSFAQAHTWLGAVLRNTGRLEEALTEFKRAQELDPVSASMNSYVAGGYLALHRPNEAIEQALLALELDPASVSAHTLLGFAYLQNSTFKEAINEMQKAIASMDPGNVTALSNLGIAYAMSGQRAEARRVLNEVERASERRHVPTDLMAVLYLMVGEKETALRLLSKAVDEQCSRWIPFMKISPMFDSVRGEARFKELLHRVRLD